METLCIVIMVTLGSHCLVLNSFLTLHWTDFAGQYEACFDLTCLINLEQKDYINMRETDRVGLRSLGN